MSLRFNPFTGNLDYDTYNFRGILTTAPSNPKEGWMYIDSTTHTFYVYYSYNWQVIHVLTTGAAPTYSTIATPYGLLLAITQPD
jgi:hypothetical protein